MSCGFKVLVEQGASIHDRTRPGDLLVKNWKPGVDLYIDVSVIDPTGQEWRNNLMLGGAGEAAMLKEIEKRNHYKNHFNLADKQHEFAPFILEAQGGVGKTALRVIRTAIQRKKEMNLRNLSRCVKKDEVTK